MCLQTTAEEEDKWGSVVRTDHQFFQEFVDDNENTKSLAVPQHELKAAATTAAAGGAGVDVRSQPPRSTVKPASLGFVTTMRL